jgi:putative phosphoesterase
MIIGIISDIHGNSIALAKVLAEARQANVDHFIVLGDMVGYYYEAAEVFQLLQPLRPTIIKGNHEQMMLDIIGGRLEPAIVQQKYGSGISIALKTLPPSTLKAIAGYEETMIIVFDDIKIRICHGSPWDINQYLYPDSELELIKSFEEIGVDFVFFGHSHYPMIYFGESSTVINPGSVGQSRLTGGVAQWGIFNTKNMVYTPRNTKYDVSPLVEEVRRVDPHNTYLETVLLRH